MKATTDASVVFVWGCFYAESQFSVSLAQVSTQIIRVSCRLSVHFIFTEWIICDGSSRPPSPCSGQPCFPPKYRWRSLHRTWAGKFLCSTSDTVNKLSVTSPINFLVVHLKARKWDFWELTRCIFGGWEEKVQQVGGLAGKEGSCCLEATMMLQERRS